LEPLGIITPLIFIGIIVLEVVIAPIPPLALYVVAGLLFGGFFGGVLVLIGNLIGALIDFKIARKFGKKVIDKKVDKKIKKKFDRFFEKRGVLAIFILRVNPITTSDIVSYLSGLNIFSQYRWLSILIILFSLIYILIFVYLIILVIFGKISKNN
jgi:uncharacterized membrane protein YdjX (TVP38/TMEM64 family)